MNNKSFKNNFFKKIKKENMNWERGCCKRLQVELEVRYGVDMNKTYCKDV